MTREQITDEILRVMSRYSEHPGAELLAASSLEELIDSMARIEIIFEIEDKYDVEIGDDEVLGIRTVADIVSCVERRLASVAG